MNFLKSLSKGKQREQQASSAPPGWTPAPETSHQFGLRYEAPEEEYETAEDFCRRFPPIAPRLLPSLAVERVRQIGGRAWGIQAPDPNNSRFIGSIKNSNDGMDDKSNSRAAVSYVQTPAQCKTVCLLSNLPILAGLYDTRSEGVYYEVLIKRMDGIVAVGTACQPYPAWRLPGWNRLSAGFHLDDFRKFFEDPDGGRDYHTPDAPGLLSRISPGDTVGCGYEFSNASIFFTYNGVRLPPAFTGVYLPRREHDVFAAIGVEGACDLEINFGAEVFRWKAANEWAWRIEAHVGRMNGTAGDFDEELPSYSDARYF